LTDLNSGPLSLGQLQLLSSRLPMLEVEEERSALGLLKRVLLLETCWWASPALLR
jgi:hypothetical protein